MFDCFIQFRSLRVYCVIRSLALGKTHSFLCPVCIFLCFCTLRLYIIETLLCHSIPWGKIHSFFLPNIWEDEEGEVKGANLDLKLQLAERSIYRRNLENMHFWLFPVKEKIIIIYVKYGRVHILHISCISTLSHILDASHRLAVVPTLSSIIASLIQGGTASYISNQTFSLFLGIWHPTPSTIIASQYYWLNLLI